jgi:hypothetical protein
VAENDNDAIDTWKLINTELAARLTRQDASVSRVEAKAILVVGFAATATQFLATRSPFKTPWSTLFAIIAIASYVLAFAVGVWSMRVAKFADLDGPNLVGLSEQTEQEVLLQLIGTRGAIFEKNAKAAERKAKAWWWSIRLLTTGLVSSVACIVQTA